MGPLKRKPSSVKLAKSKSMSGRKKGSKKRLSDVVDEAIKSDKEDDKDEESKEQQLADSEKKREEEKKNRYPIAPDGYLPNSVIRQVLRPKVVTPVETKAEEPWKLKPAPRMDTYQTGRTSRISDGGDITLYLSEAARQKLLDGLRDLDNSMRRSRSHNFAETRANGETSMSNPNDNADDRSQDYDEVTAVQVHHMSRESTTLPVPGRELSAGAQQNHLNSEATSLSKGRALQSTLSRQVTRTSAISEEDVRRTDLLQHISEEPWYPPGAGATLEGVVDAFVTLMDSAADPVHKQVCDYIVQIHREIGYPDPLLDRLVDKLLDQLTNPEAYRRIHALETLSELGLNRKSIIKGILSLLADPNISDEIHQLAEDTLMRLTGARDKETLDKQLDKIGLGGDRCNNHDQKPEVEEYFDGDQHRADNMSGLPEARHDQLVETWLEGTKGVEKDLTGLYREDTDAVSKGSADKGSRHSPEKDQSRRNSPLNDTKNKLSVPNLEKEQLLKSHLNISTSSKLTPDNPLMYKMYDSQRQALAASSEKSTKVTRFEDNVQSFGEKSPIEDDSGFGQEVESSCYSREKSSALRPGTRNLSPVQASDNESDVNVEKPDQADTENWRVFFDEARKRKELDSQTAQDVAKATREPINLPPIRYLGDDVEMVPDDSGQRLLQSVSVKHKGSGSAGSAGSSSNGTQRHRIQPLHGRLGATTDSESSPEPSENRKFLPALVPQPETQDDWRHPLASSGEKKYSPCGITPKRDTQHFCDYSRLLKKRMHHHISIGRYLGNKRIAEIASDVTVPLSTAKGIGHRLATLRLSAVH